MTNNPRAKEPASDYSHYGEGFGHTTHTTTGYGEHTHRTPPPRPESVDTSEAFLIAAAVSGFPAAVSGCLFSNPMHRSIADTLRTMKSSGDPIDFATALSRLEPTESAALRAIVAEPANLSAMDGEAAAIAYHQTQLKTAAHHRQLNAKQRELNEAVVTGDLSRIVALAGELGALAGNGDTDDLSILDERRIRLHPQPQRPPPLFKLKGQGIATAGNLMQIQAQAKAGKSAVVGAMIAAVIVGDADEGEGQWEAADLLGFSASSNHDKRAVITFDTEQSQFDAWRLIQRTCDRAKVEQDPPWLRSYRVNDISLQLLRKAVQAEMKRAAQECGGVLAVFIDGGADMCVDPNETREAFALVGEWAALASKYECLIAVVIHENPGGVDTAKTRGHLGSQLARKAETSLRLLTGGDGVTEVYTLLGRSCFIPKGEGQLIKYDADAGMHVSVQRETAEGRADLRRAELVDPLEEIFEGVVGGMKWVEFNHAIGRVMELKGGSVGRMLKEFLALGMVKKDASTKRYCRVTTNYQNTTK
jgi:hypothetical protein